MSETAETTVVHAASKLTRRGPMGAEHRAVTKPEVCAACHEAFHAGDYTTLIPLGPADDAYERRRCREGRVYNAAAALVHWACATGLED